MPDRVFVTVEDVLYPSLWLSDCPVSRIAAMRPPFRENRPARMTRRSCDLRVPDPHVIEAKKQ